MAEVTQPMAEFWRRYKHIHALTGNECFSVVPPNADITSVSAQQFDAAFQMGAKDGNMSRLRSIVFGMLGMNDRNPTERHAQPLTNDMYGMLAVLDKVGGGKPAHTPKPGRKACSVDGIPFERSISSAMREGLQRKIEWEVSKCFKMPGTSCFRAADKGTRLPAGPLGEQSCEIPFPGRKYAGRDAYEQCPLEKARGLVSSQDLYRTGRRGGAEARSYDSQK